jgi:glycosyltransferase involved in cell wall biosynthesis
VVVNGIDQNVETIGDAGVVCKSGDIADMQTKLSTLLDDRPRIGRLGADARRRIMAVYDWNAVVDRLEQLYYALTERNNARC